MNAPIFARHKDTILYGIALACLLFLLKWIELRLVVFNHTMEVYIGVIAFIFTALGIWLALKLSQPKVETVIVEKEVLVKDKREFVMNEQELLALGISKRELEVLELIADGLSNKEIAEQLFVSLNTIKTHSSRLFEKMEVKSRTQAIEKAKRLSIIA